MTHEARLVLRAANRGAPPSPSPPPPADGGLKWIVIGCRIEPATSCCSLGRDHVPSSAADKDSRAWAVIGGMLATPEVHLVRANYCPLVGPASLFSPPPSYHGQGVGLVRAHSLTPGRGFRDDCCPLELCDWPGLAGTSGRDEHRSQSSPHALILHPAGPAWLLDVTESQTWPHTRPPASRIAGRKTRLLRNTTCNSTLSHALPRMSSIKPPKALEQPTALGDTFILSEGCSSRAGSPTDTSLGDHTSRSLGNLGS